MKGIILAIVMFFGGLNIHAFGIPEKATAEIGAAAVVLYSRERAAHRIICKSDAKKELLRLAELHALSQDAGCFIFVTKNDRGDISLKSMKINHKKVIVAGEPVAVADILDYCGIKLDEFLGDIGK